jgi:hypothetical protein
MDNISKKASKAVKAFNHALSHPEHYGPVQHHSDHPSVQLMQQQQQQQQQQQPSQQQMSQGHLSSYFQRPTQGPQVMPQQTPFSQYPSSAHQQVSIPAPYGSATYHGPPTSVVPAGLSGQLQQQQMQHQNFAQFGQHGPNSQVAAQFGQQTPITQAAAPQFTAAQTSWPPSNPGGMAPTAMSNPYQPSPQGFHTAITPANQVSPFVGVSTPHGMTAPPFSPISPLQSAGIAMNTPIQTTPMSNPNFPSGIHELPAQTQTQFVAELPANPISAHPGAIELPADIPLGTSSKMSSPPPPPLLAASADASIHRLEQPKPVHPDQTAAATAQTIATMTPVSPPPFSPPTLHQPQQTGNLMVHQGMMPAQGHQFSALANPQMQQMIGQQPVSGINQQVAAMPGAGNGYHVQQPVQPQQLPYAAYNPGMYGAMPNAYHAGAANTSAAIVQQQQLAHQQKLMQQQAAAAQGFGHPMSGYNGV